MPEQFVGTDPGARPFGSPVGGAAQPTRPLQPAAPANSAAQTSADAKAAADRAVADKANQLKAQIPKIKTALAETRTTADGLTADLDSVTESLAALKAVSNRLTSADRALLDTAIARAKGASDRVNNLFRQVAAADGLTASSL